MADLIRSFTAEDGTKFRIFDLDGDVYLEDGPVRLAAFHKFADAQDDEWGVFALAMLAPDWSLERFEAIIRREHERDDAREREYLFKRNVAFGITWSQVVNEPHRWIKKWDSIVGAIHPPAREALASMPVEALRRFREEQREGESE